MAEEYTPAGSGTAFTVPTYADVADGPKLAKDLADDVAAKFSIPSRAETLANKTLGSNLAAGGFKITGLGDPSSAQDAVTKNWVETGMSSQLVQATTQATNAASSASAASTSATAAAASQSAAASSASAASGSASSAATQASNASTSATNAASSASTASTQASNAASSATAAAASASAASTSQTAAAGSATAAASSASSASTSAASAAASATAAAATYDAFDDRYLGSKSSAPTVDNDGNALLTGALYYLNTGTSEQVGMYAWDGAAWVKAGSSGIADGSVTTAKIADSAITTAKVANSAITNAKLSNSSITINGSAVSLGGSVDVTGESFHPFLLIGA